MSKYNRFEDFMVAVVKTADTTCAQRYGQNLNNLYKVKSSALVAAILALIDKGWGVFLAVWNLICVLPECYAAIKSAAFSAIILVAA